MNESRGFVQFFLGSLTLAATAFAALAAWKSYEVAERTQAHQEDLHRQREKPIVVFRQKIIDLPFEKPALPVVNIGEVPVTDVKIEWSGLNVIRHYREKREGGSELGPEQRINLAVHIDDQCQELTPSVLKRDETGDFTSLPVFCDRLKEPGEQIEGVLRLSCRSGQADKVHQTAHSFICKPIDGGVRLHIDPSVDWINNSPWDFSRDSIFGK